jgi:hypothetical protein
MRMPYSGWNFTSSLCTRERWKAVNHQYNKASTKAGEKGTRWKDPSLGKWRILQRGWTATGTGTNQVPKERERERRKCESYQPVNPPSLMLKECEIETEYKNLQWQ